MRIRAKVTEGGRYRWSADDLALLTCQRVGDRIKKPRSPATGHHRDHQRAEGPQRARGKPQRQPAGESDRAEH